MPDWKQPPHKWWPRVAASAPGPVGEASGGITIGDFTETFEVPLGFWDESDYRRSWREAFEVLNADPAPTSCLMTSMTDPRMSNFLVCWPMYRRETDEDGNQISEWTTSMDSLREFFG